MKDEMRRICAFEGEVERKLAHFEGRLEALASPPNDESALVHDSRELQAITARMDELQDQNRLLLSRKEDAARGQLEAGNAKLALEAAHINDLKSYSDAISVRIPLSIDRRCKLASHFTIFLRG